MQNIKYNFGKQFYFCLLIISLFSHCVLFQKKIPINPIPFDYQSIGKNYFNPKNNKPFPLTIQRGNNLYNSVTADGKYLFYSTDKDGNFNIWFRDLGSSIVVPVTNHPSQEYKPAISPDGKKLIFVSESYDPEGDLILLNMEADDWVQSSIRGERFINQDFQVLTNDQWKDQRFQQRVIDTDPAWFPDNRRIVFSSDRYSPGIQNLITLDTVTRNMSKLTYDGGSSPYVSLDGRVIYYLSYQDSELGEIYSFNIETESIQRLTHNSSLDFSPSVSRDQRYLYYTSIPKDTNGNGVLDERDKSYVVQKDLTNNKVEYLTSGENSVFDTRYSDFNGGSVLFSASLYNAINIYFIPSKGSIPRQDSIIEQFNYALEYEMSGSYSQFLLALDSVELFFDDDPLYPIYKSRVMAAKIEYLRLNKRLGLSKEIYNKLLTDSEKRNELSLAYSISLNSNISADTIPRITSILNKVSHEDKEMRASILHLIADILDRNKNYPQLIQILNRIQNEYPNYHLIRDIKTRFGYYDFTTKSNVLPKFYIESIQNYESKIEKDEIISNIQKSEIKGILKDIHRKIPGGKTPDETLEHIETIQRSRDFPTESIIIRDFLDFLKAEALRYKKSLIESSKILNRIIPIPENQELYPLNEKAIFEIPLYIKKYKNPTLSYAHYLKFKNSQELGENANALRDLQIFMEFYDPELSPELENKELTYLFLYWENKAIEFERLGNLREAAFHYYFNNLGMALAKSKNLSEEEFYSNYAVYYQRKMIDTVFAHGQSLREKEEENLLQRLNLLNEDNLDVLGNLSTLFSYAKKLPLLDALKFFGDFRDLITKDAIHEEALLLSNLYFNYHLEKNRPYLNLAVSYGHAYYLINRAVINEKYLYDRNNMTEAKKIQILENYKKAEYELRWILYTDPTFPDAYQLLGWLYQYIDIMKAKQLGLKEPTEEERYARAYNRYFPEKNFEENVELYTQILEFLGKDYNNKKVLSDINLNLGNNYFLLNNFPRANETASKVEEYSQSILSKSQFDDYRQEAVYRYNYGRSSLYRGNLNKAIEQFKISLKLYTDFEYKNVLSQGDNEDSIEQMIQVKSKMALLNAMIGLTFIEAGEYENSISYIQQAISYNRNSNYLDSTNLWNALAISYQKTERFIESQNVLKLAEESYKTMVNSYSGWGISIQDKFWSIFLPDSIRVMGNGRFPGELPLHFKGLLTESISINNLIEIKDFHKAIQQIDKRDKLINDKSLKKWVMGNLVSHKSISLKAQIFYESKEYEKAYQQYKEMAKIFREYENWEQEQIAQTSRSYSGFAMFEEREVTLNNDDIHKIIIILEDNLTQLFEAQKYYISNCARESDENNCKERFRKKFIRYEILLGLNHFYLGESKALLGEDISVSFHFNRAVELLENSGGIEPNIHFLPSDPLTRRERIRNILNLSRIYLRLGDENKSRVLQNKAQEMANEFRLGRESFLSQLTKLEIELKSDKNYPTNNNNKYSNSLSNRNIFVSLDKLFNENQSIRFSLPKYVLNEYEVRTKDYLGMTNQFWKIPQSVDSFTQDRIAIETITSKLEYSDLILNAKVKSYNRIINKTLQEERHLEQKSILRENVQSNLLNLTNLRKSRYTLEDEIIRDYPRYSIYTLKPSYLKPIMNVDSIYIRCQVVLEKEVFWIQTKNSKELVQDTNQEYMKNFVQNIKNYKSILWNPGDCRFNHSKIVQSLTDNRWNLVFMDRDVNTDRIREGIDGRRISIINNQNHKTIQTSQLRLINDEKIGYKLLDTDLLFIPYNQSSHSKSVFSNEGLGNLNVRELATNRSELSAIIFEGNGSKLIDLDYLKSIYYHTNVWRDTNLIFTPILSMEERLNLTRDSISNSMITVGVLPRKIETPNSKNRYKELKNLGNIQERIKNYQSAYDLYYKAGTFVTREDNEEYLENVIDIARTKRRLIKDSTPDQFIIPLLHEFKNDSTSTNRIFTSYLADCFSDRQLQNKRKVCEKYYQDWIKSNPPQAGTIRFYYNLYMGYTRDLDSNRKNLEKLTGIDEFINKLAIADLYLENFLFDEARKYAEEARNLTNTDKEKEIIRNKIYEIQFHQAYLAGIEDFTYKKIEQEITYALGYNREWNKYLVRVNSPNFKKLGESDQIFENYRKKMYQNWRDWNYGEEFESTSLFPDELYEGGSVLSRLTHLNRTLLFYLIKESSKHQLDSESDRLMNQIIDKEREEGFHNRAYAFTLYYSDELYRSGKINSARNYLKKFEELYNPQLIHHPILVNKYAYLKLKQSIFSSDIHFTNEYIELLSNDDKIVYSYIKKMKAEGIGSFASILNHYVQTKGSQNIPFTLYHKNKLKDLIQFMKQFSLTQNSTEGFLDAIHFDQIINSYTERTLGRKPFLNDLPKFQSIHKELINKLPSSQEISIVNDFLNTTYLIQVVDGKTKGRELFKDNRDIKSLIRLYYRNSSLNGDDSRNREIIDDRYRNFLRLNPEKTHYLYLTDYHFKAPISAKREILTFHIQNLESLILNPFVPISSYPWMDSYIKTKKESTFNDLWFQTLKSTEDWEFKSTSNKGGMPITISQEETRIDENGHIVFGGTPIASVSKKKSKRQGTWIPSSNYLNDKLLLSHDLNSLFFHLDSIHSGIGFMSIDDQSDFHNLYFINRLLEKKTFPMNGQDRFIESRNQLRSIYPYDRFWMRYRMYTTSFVRK